MTDLGLTIPRSLVLLAHDQPERARELVASRAQLASTASLMPFLFANRLVDIHHYVGNNLAAWLHWEAIWRAYSRGPFNRVQIPRMILHHQRARCAVGATAERWDDSLAHLARAEARIVLRMDRPESRALAAGVHATLAFQQGKKDRARGQLGDAVAAAAEAGIAPFTDCYRWVLGRITDGSEGAQLFGRADASLRRQGVLNPARWAAVYAPGFGNLEPLDPTQR
jgi:hypothetical protein